MNSKKDAMTMSKAEKRNAAPWNHELASARSLVKGRLEEAVEDREDEIRLLQQLIPQIDEASPCLIQKFALEAPHPLSKFADEFMVNWLSYLDRGGAFAPPYGYGDDVIRLDDFLYFYLTQEALRRARDASSSQEAKFIPVRRG
jgi:hypothetical protein